MATPYIPTKLPLDSIDWLSLIPKMGEANRAVASFNGILNGIPNPDLLLSPLINNEAVLSSKIEGTQVDTIDVLQFEAGITEETEERKNDIVEVINYRKALSYGTGELAVRSVSLNLIKQLHYILLDHARGQSKTPGEIRSVQNYIGSPAGGIDNARFVPPDPLIVPEYMDNYIEYLNSSDKDILVQAAILHAQFEIIHPFCDGNGRLGRMLVPLFLCQKKIISRPVLYISQFLDQNEMRYKDSLKAITDKNDWTQWIDFFLDAIKWQADTNYKVADAIQNYYKNTKSKILETTSSQHAIALFDAMIAKPIFRQSNLTLPTNPSKATIFNLLQQFEANGIVSIKTKGSGRSGNVYHLKELLEIANGK